MKINHWIATALLTAFGSVSGQAQDTSGVMLTTENEMIYTIDKVELTGGLVLYRNTAGKYKKISQKKVKIMTVGSRIFLMYPQKKNGRDLQLMELLAMNDKYLLLQYWLGTYWEYYIFDHHDHMVREGFSVAVRRGNIGRKNNLKAIEEIRPYFKSCSELFEKFDWSIENLQDLSTNIVALRCDGAPELGEIIERFKNKSFD